MGNGLNRLAQYTPHTGKPLTEKRNKLMELMSALNVSGGGNAVALGGRIGLDNVPLTDNLNASVGASGYYLPQQNQGQFNTYDAALNYYMGKRRQHELGVAAQGLNTQDPRYMLNYKFKF